ncbi:MAG: hypothetical protein JW982_09100 [Spirochaetes bacterium]|nr:hypothetical protein [Spirochaetota bacterium]
MKLFKIAITMLIIFISVHAFANGIYDRSARMGEDTVIETVLLPFSPENENKTLSGKITDSLFLQISDFQYSFPEIRKEPVPGAETAQVPVDFYRNFFIRPDSSHPEFVIRMKLTKRVEKVQKKEKTTFMKYIIENRKNEFYTVEFEFLDLYGNSILEKYSKEITEEQYMTAVNEFSEIIKKYYKPRTFPLTGKFDLITYSSLTVSFLFPMGKYSKISTMGTGLTASYYIENILYNNLVFSPSISYDYYSGNASDILSYSSMKTDIGAGYSFYNLLLNNSKIIFITKAGYIFHFIKYSTESKIFYDPYITLSSDFHYGINDRIDLNLGLSLSTFFEISNSGFFAELNAGASYIF